ncbi:hypothetical protein J2W46_005875 [Paraburkholderia strydomiana]|nr:hypothetical protein [Paraburkholderia strydomiana]
MDPSKAVAECLQYSRIASIWLQPEVRLQRGDGDDAFNAIYPGQHRKRYSAPSLENVGSVTEALHFLSVA